MLFSNTPVVVERTLSTPKLSIINREFYNLIRDEAEMLFSSDLYEDYGFCLVTTLDGGRTLFIRSL